MENYLAPYRPVFLSIFRIMAGLMILQFGTAKILGFPAVPYSPMLRWGSGRPGMPACSN